MSENSAYDANGHRKYLNNAEGQKFLVQARCLAKRRKLFCLTLYFTGCRISEALALHASDLEVELNVIRIRSLKKRGKSVIRRIPVPEFLVNELHTIAQENKPLWRFSRITGWRIVKDVMREAGISGIHATAKGLRHGFGVRCVLAQIAITLIQYWMGHASLANTAIYLAVNDDEARELIKKTWQ